MARVESLVSRPIEPGRLQAARPLHALEWVASESRGGADDDLRLVAVGDIDLPGLELERYADLAAFRESSGDSAPDVVLLEVPAAWLTGEGPAGAAGRLTRCALDLLRDWVAQERLRKTRLVFLTRGAMAALDGEVPDASLASLASLLRSADLEQPGRFGLIDVDESDASLAALPVALARRDEPQLALRDGATLAPRIVRSPAPEDDRSLASIDSERTVLITGGTGGIGAQIARHLVSAYGVRHLLLLSRRGPRADDADRLEAELAELGADVAIVACDVSDRSQLEAAIDSVPGSHPLGAVIHAAAVVDDGTIESLSNEQVDRVLGPKVDAAWHLHELTERLGLSAFVLFSSAAGTVGSPGQSHYAAANGFLDALAACRRAAGLPARSIAWGLWPQATGPTAELGEADLARMRRGGVEAMTDEQGLTFFDAALADERSLSLAVCFNLASLRSLVRVGFAPAIVRGLVRMPSRRPAGGSLREKLAAMPEGEREEFVRGLVREEGATVLGHQSAQAVDPERNFTEMGLDSLGAVELSNRLEARTGLPMRATVAFEYPTPTALATHMLGEASRSARPEGPGVRPEGTLGEGSEAADGSLGSLFTRARQQGKELEFLQLLRSAAPFRASFDAALEPGQAPAPVSLAAGASGPKLICIATATPMSGAHEYMPFAKGFDGIRDVLALPQSGFVPGEAVPASLGAAVETLAGTARDVAGGEPFVLLGHSTGGLYAHAVAAQLEAEGVAPAAVVVVDSYREVKAEVIDPLATAVLAVVDETEMVNTTRLTAMGVHLQLLSEWSFSELSAPVLLVRCSESLPGALADTEWRVAPWGGPEVEVPGNHFSMMQEHAGATAQAIEDWLGGLE